MAVHLLLSLFVSLNLSFQIFAAQIDVPLDLSTRTAVTAPIPCKTDRDCPETSYCFESKNSVCVRCFDCANRNRQSRIRCARAVEDCGDCLPGYVSDAYPHLRRWCRKQTTTKEAQPHRMEQIDSFDMKYYLTIVGICCLSFLGFASFYCYSNRNYRTVNVSNTITSETNSQLNYVTATASCALPPPPPYQENIDSDDDGVSCSFQLRVIEHSTVDQKAVPCSYDENSIINHGSSVQSSMGTSPNNIPLSPNEASASGAPGPSYHAHGAPGPSHHAHGAPGPSYHAHGAPGPSHHAHGAPGPSYHAHNLQIHDEDTSPSFWTPGENYGVSENQTAQTTNNTKTPMKRKSADDPENAKKPKDG